MSEIEVFFYREGGRPTKEPDRVCDVCLSHPPIGVACSQLGAVSFAYCRECLDNNAEPKSMCRSLLLTVSDIEEIHPEYRGIKYFEDGEYRTLETLLLEKRREEIEENRIFKRVYTKMRLLEDFDLSGRDLRDSLLLIVDDYGLPALAKVLDHERFENFRQRVHSGDSCIFDTDGDGNCHLCKDKKCQLKKRG